MSIIIKQLELGPMENNIYVVWDSITKEAVVIDPAWDVPAILQFIQDEALILSKVLLTHGHYDHVNGLPGLLKEIPVPVYLSEHEIEVYRPNCPLIDLKDGDTIPLGESAFKVIHTPGHTPGCVCFWIENNLISGDTLFIGAAGRCDLQGGDEATLFESFNKLLRLPDDLVVYPGHKYNVKKTDTLGNQKRTNPFFRGAKPSDILRRKITL
ncbi:MAG: MBL fold metallo-hydrolase [Candidatus Margulisiibacteriota bacterium]